MARSRTEPPKATELAKLYRSVRREAHESLEARLESLIDERRETNRTQREAEGIAHAALGRTLAADDEYRSSIARTLKAAGRDADRSPSRLERLDRTRGKAISKETALAILSGSGVSGIANDRTASLTITMDKDTVAQSFLPPYQDASVSKVFRGGYRQLDAWADKQSGDFGFAWKITRAGGDLYSSAAIWISFVRQVPAPPPPMGAPGSAQVRTRPRFSQRWQDASYLATAHQHAGFGVYVVSWDLSGGDFRVAQDHRYWEWSDGTGWYEQHNNWSYPSYDDGIALTSPTEAPYFPVQPGRMYAAAVWCFGAGDAAGMGGATSGSWGSGSIQATADFIVVGQQ